MLCANGTAEVASMSKPGPEQCPSSITLRGRVSAWLGDG